MLSKFRLTLLRIKPILFAFLIFAIPLKQNPAVTYRMNSERQPPFGESGTDLEVYAFSQTDENTLLAVARDAEHTSTAVILKSTDQGQTWRRKAVYSRQYLLNIAFLSSTVGMAVGISGFALKTTDGGETWENLQISSDSFTPFIRVQFLDQDRIRLLSEDGEVFTRDGGRTWKRYTFAFSGRREEGAFYGWLNAFSYSQQNELWVLGDRGQVYRSKDDGLSWKEYGEPFAKLAKKKDFHTLDFKEVHFFSAKLGFIFAQTRKELLLFKTEDEGETWRLIKRFGQSLLFVPQFLSPTNIWFEDVAHYCLYHTADGGKTWQQRPIPSTEEGRDAFYPFFMSETSGWLFYKLFRASFPGMRTDDGGRTWHRQSVQLLEK